MVSQSIYVNDPDGNNVELYVDADPAIWREKPETVDDAPPTTDDSVRSSAGFRTTRPPRGPDLRPVTWSSI